MQIPKDFIEIFPKIAFAEDEGPLYYLFMYDPYDDKVYVEHDKGEHRADVKTHKDLALKSPHPDKVFGYVYRLKSHWRVTDWDHKPIKDPYILRKVKAKIDGKESFQTTSYVQKKVIAQYES